MKFVYAALVLLALAVAALFLVPPFLDWERFKPEITERLEAITGRTVTIEGAIAVSILPAPTITVADLRIANAPGAAARDMVRIKSLDLALALGPLLGGEVAVTSLEMVEPVIELERLADGRPNWLFERAPGAAPEGTAAVEAGDAGDTGEAGDADAAALEPARIDSASVRNGTIVYRHGDDRLPERIERIDAVLSARTLDGPFRADGEFTLRGRAVAFQLATGTIGEGRTLRVSIEASAGGDRGSALFEGVVSGIDGALAFDGTVRAQAPDLGALLGALEVDLGGLPAAPLGSAFSAKGALGAHAGAVSARDLQLRLGESQAIGSLSWQGGETPLFDGKITLDRIDLDRFLPSGEGPEAEPAAADPGGDGEAGRAAAPAALQTIPEDVRQMIPGDIAATFDLAIGTLIWRQGVVRQARTQLGLEDGVVTIRQASALLPGGADVQLSGWLTGGGEGPWLEASAEIAADDLRAVLAWLDVDADAVPADRLRRLSASVDVSARDDRISASSLDIRVDTARIAGSASVETGERPRLTARLAVDTVNVDAYLPAPTPVPAGAAPSPGAGGANAASQEAARPAAEHAAAGTWAALAEIDADVTLTVDTLTYDGVRFAGLELDALLEDGDLSVRRASVADALGASLSVRGDARRVWTAPTVAFTVDGKAHSLSGPAALLDIDPDIRTEAYGEITLNGSLAGDADALTVDLALAAATAEVSLAGTIERAFDTPAGALTLNLRASDAAALARTVGLTPTAAIARLGALAIDASLDGNLDSLGIDLRTETAGAVLNVAGRLMDPLTSPSYSAAVDISHPRVEALIETMVGGAPADVALGPLHIVGTVSGDKTVADIAGIGATLGGNRVSGGVFLRLDQEPPAINADLRAGTLDLAWLGGGLAAADEGDGGAVPAFDAGRAGSGTGNTLPATARWSDEPIDLAVLDRFSGTLTLDADALILGAYRIEQAEIDLASAEGTLTLRALSGRLFDGALEAEGSLSRASVPKGQGAFRLTGADIGAVLRGAAGVDAVSGRATIDGKFALSGHSAREMVRALAGRATIVSRKGAVEGVDLPAISRQIGALAELDKLDDIASFVAAVERSLSGGQTAVRSLDGVIAVRDGQARIETFRIVADGATGDIAGSADLPAWHIDLTALFRLVEHPDAPPVGVRLEGPIDRPERRYLIEEMQAHLVRLGLLSLSKSRDLPTITLRKGAKAEPGSEMDTLLRDVFGDPEKAGEAKEVEEVEEAEEAAETEAAEETVEAEAAEEPARGDRAEEAEGPDAADGEGESAAPPPADGSAPLPPSAPERDRDADLRDFVDDLLRTLDE